MQFKNLLKMDMEPAFDHESLLSLDWGNEESQLETSSMPSV